MEKCMRCQKYGGTCALCQKYGGVTKAKRDPSGNQPPREEIVLECQGCGKKSGKIAKGIYRKKLAQGWEAVRCPDCGSEDIVEIHTCANQGRG